MKVLHLISGGEVGGSKNHLISLVNGMKDTEIKSIIVCLIKGKLYNEALKMVLDVRLVKQSSRLDIFAASKIAKICNDEGVDIINCHGGRANFTGYFLKKKYDAIYITTIHSDYREDYRGNLYKTFFYGNLNSYLLRGFDYYITVSDKFKEMLISRGFESKRIFSVYNGIDFNEKRVKYVASDIIEKYSIKPAGHYVTMVARFHPVKGHRFFLDSCKIVLQSFSDVVFILVGDGQLFKDMKDYAKEIGIIDNVYFAGFKKPDEFVYISDYTTLTSFTESFPLSILESAFYKKTVISTNVGGIPTLIKDGFNGYLVKPMDSLSMSAKMMELLKNTDIATLYGERLYDDAKDNYSLEKFVQRYIYIYKITFDLD